MNTDTAATRGLSDALLKSYCVFTEGTAITDAPLENMLIIV
jgi:hypothetical protein